MDLYKPIEEPRSKYFGKNYLAVYSRKLDRVVHFFSILEYYNFLLLEMNHEVITFCEKPKQIEVLIDGKWKNYPERKTLLENAGYNYSEVQKRVNEMLR